MTELEALRKTLEEFKALQELRAQIKDRLGEESEQFKLLTPLIEQLTAKLNQQLTGKLIEQVLARIEATNSAHISVEGELSSALSQNLTPIVRYMLLCEDCLTDPKNPRRISIAGLLSHFNAVDDPPYPAFCEELCVFLALTEGRGQGRGKIVCTYEESGQKIWESREHFIEFGPDPLEVTAVLFRICRFWFPHPGRYLIEFWYDGVKVEERPLLLR